MSQKKPSNIRMIEKLAEIAPNLTGEEAEAARYQIERLREKNPFISVEEKNPETVLECWEARDTSRTKILTEQAEIEKNLLQGYKVILKAEESEDLKTRINRTQRKIFFMQKELEAIKRFIEDASNESPQCKGVNAPQVKPKKEGAETREKRTGKANLTITNLEERNPLHRNPIISIYVDEDLAVKIKKEEIGESKPVFISFERAYKIEILIETEENIVIGWVYFPVTDLVEVQDKGTRTLYYSISDISTVSISFGECVLEKKRLARKQVVILTRREAGHNMRKLESLSYHYCGVCCGQSPNEAESEYYRCDWCKFTCHIGCIRKIFFECVEYTKRREEEEERGRLEQKLVEMRNERMKMIIAAVDVREKPEEETKNSKRSENPQEMESLQEQPQVPVKRYRVAHVLEKKKTLGVSWCHHCGERIGVFVQALECSVCDNMYHMGCKGVVFKSCGITQELLESLVTYEPKTKKGKDEEISIKEFDLVSVIGRGTFGKVFLARWKGKLVALKAIKKEDVLEKNSVTLLETERKCLEIAKSSKNPFLIEMKGYFQSGSYVFFAQEFVPGGDLYQHAGKKTFGAEDMKIILAEVILAVEFLHKNNIIYRDLKLENILLDKDGHVKLADFGLCSIGAKNGVARTFCGSITSVAPEVIDGKYTKSVDWWGVGVAAYELVTGKTPFQGETAKRICESIQNDEPEEMEKIPADLRGLVQGLLEKDPEERLGKKSAQEIKEHEYFKGLDWGRVFAKSFKMQWKPDPENMKNFDSSFMKEKPVLSPALIPDDSQKSQFQNF